jgi:hypothetical protein
LYGYETLSLAIREEHRLRLFGNKVLRRVFGTKRGEMAEGRRIVHTEELHNLYALPNVIRVIKSKKMRWAGACSTHGKK